MREYCLNINKIININNNNLELDHNIINKFKTYLGDIEDWRKVHNIVSGNFSQDDLLENLFDSVVGGSFLSIKERIYDAGSGGGFPAIPLAILFPKTKFYLVESSRKKCSFLRREKNILKLDNIVIENKRLESFSDLEFITTKAAFSPPNIGLLWEALAKHGKLALWATDKNRESFRAALGEKGAKLSESWEYYLPEGQRRCILLFTKT